MTLNESLMIAGLLCIPTVTEGEKAQLQLTFPNLPKKQIKDKKSGEKVEQVCFMAKRSISDVTRFFQAVTDPTARLAMATMQLPEANSVIFKALKEIGSSPLDFYLEANALIESMEAEVESVSAADPRNSIASFLASQFNADDTVGSGEEIKSIMLAKLAQFSDEDWTKVASILTDKEGDNGRTDSGQIRFRKQRTPKEEAAIVAE